MLSINAYIFKFIVHFIKIDLINRKLVKSTTSVGSPI